MELSTEVEAVRKDLELKKVRLEVAGKCRVG